MSLLASVLNKYHFHNQSITRFAVCFFICNFFSKRVALRYLPGNIIHTLKSDFITPYPTPTVSIQFPFSRMLPI